ncbi:hypothetical protein COHA_003686 [Chlorella ohadii]|uniref:Histone deacetylase domain-containing protein n=1 Tax=Chlorella ohadii TaxID=2649997 RepID=A0AAD5DQV7_9CHLO|nr:hypothetical protein COHA_003686 [Chlorella ohadii]
MGTASSSSAQAAASPAGPDVVAEPSARPSAFAACARPDVAAAVRGAYADLGGWPVDTQLPICYSPAYNISFWGLERLHPFDSKKFQHVLALLEARGVLSAGQLVEAQEATHAVLREVHTERYLNKLNSSSLKVAMVTELAPLAFLPTFLLRRKVLQPMATMAGGTMLAAALAMQHGWAINLGGGFHHAAPDNGGGWCPFSDIYLAARRLRAASGGLVRRVMVIDTDVHQGNGVARCKQQYQDEDLFIVDIYNAKAYPWDKDAKPAIDVARELQPAAGDAEYLEALSGALAQAFDQFSPDLIIYNAGTDILAGDPLGRLQVSQEAVVRRDEMVWQAALDHRQGPARRGALGRTAWAALAPFLLAALLGSLFFRATSSRREAVVQRQRSVLEEQSKGSPSFSGLERSGAALAAAGAGGHRCHDSRAAAAACRKCSGSGGSGSGEAPAAGELPKLFLFIGILSGRGYRHRRLAVREAWANKAQIPGQVVAKFILSEDERTPQVESELEEFGDIVFVREKTNYKSILFKTFYVMEYAVTHYDVAYVLKTDDDAFINVAPMVEQLKLLCQNPGCQNERLYMGTMARHSEVMLQPGHKWNNAVFYNHTGLKQYPNYMMGGGYVIGGEVARMLVDIHARMRLKFTPIEDATLGFWLMPMELRHIDHPRFFTWAAPCCFKAPRRVPGERFVLRFQLTDEFEDDICSTDPWLVLHKIDSPTKMRIEEYVSPEVRQQWAERNAAYWAERGGRPPMDDRSKRKAKKGEEEAEGGSSAEGSSDGGSSSGGVAQAAGAAGGAAAQRATADAMAAAAAGAAGSGTATLQQQ